MPFIGIISNEEDENCIRRNIIEKLELKESWVLFIKEKSIDNIKNIKFETILICRKFNDEKTLKKLLENTKYLIINSDIEDNLKLIKNVKTTVITYGFNSKATITASSVTEDEILVCVQRTFETNNKKKVEPQEICAKGYENSNSAMAVEAVLLIHDKII